MWLCRPETYVTRQVIWHATSRAWTSGSWGSDGTYCLHLYGPTVQKEVGLLYPLTQKQHFCSKHPEPPTERHRVTSHKMLILKYTAARTSNLTNVFLSHLVSNSISSTTQHVDWYLEQWAVSSSYVIKTAHRTNKIVLLCSDTNCVSYTIMCTLSRLKWKRV